MSQQSSTSTAADQPPQTSTASDSNKFEINKKPVCILVLGMAGSGKTEFVKRLATHRHDTVKPYTINLDPACRETPYQTNIGETMVQLDFGKSILIFPN